MKRFICLVILILIGTCTPAYSFNFGRVSTVTITENGIIVRTGSGTAAARTITGSGRVAITNGDGVSGNPVISVTGDFEPFTIASPDSGDEYLWFKAPTAMTVTDIHAICIGGTSIVIDVQECDGAGANCATLDATITADTDGAEDDGTLSNGAIDAGDWVKIVMGTETGTVGSVTVVIFY